MIRGWLVFLIGSVAALALHFLVLSTLGDMGEWLTHALIIAFGFVGLRYFYKDATQRTSRGLAHTWTAVAGIAGVVVYGAGSLAYAIHVLGDAL